MVAAISAARPAPDACVASELGTLLFTRAVIRDPRWRVRAAIELVPALVRHDIPLDRIRADVLDGVAGAICPEPLRAQVIELLDSAFATGPARVLAQLADVLWSTSWANASIGAVSCALRLGQTARVATIVALVREPYIRGRLAELVRRGVLGRHGKHGSWGQFVPDIREPGSEAAFEPSLPMVLALVDANRAVDAERVAATLPAGDRAIAVAHLARASYALGEVNAATSRVRSIRADSVRAGAGLLLVRAALARGRVDDARGFAAAIEPELFRQRAGLEIARHLFEAREVYGALRPFDHRALQAEQFLLRAEIRLAAWRREPAVCVPDALVRDAHHAPWWTALEPGIATGHLDVTVRESVVRCASFARFAVRESNEAVGAVAAAQLPGIVPLRTARRALLAVFDRAGIDPFAALVTMREHRGAFATDPMFAELTAWRADAIVRSTRTLPEAFVRGLSGARASSDDRDSLERALYDEGVALSANVAQRRRAVIAAARNCMRAAVTTDSVARLSPELVQSRARTLAHLGGGLARDALTSVMTIRRPASVVYFHDALEALCRVDRAAAAEIVLARACEPERSGVDLDRALRLVELHGGLPVGFSRAWSTARTALGDQLSVIDRGRTGERVTTSDVARAWLGQLVAETGGAPSLDVLAWIAQREMLPATPRDLYAEIERTAGVIDRGTPIDAVTRVARDLGVLDALLLLRPPRVEPRLPKWSSARWKTLLYRAMVPQSGVPDRGIVGRFVRMLGRPRAVDAMLRGDLAPLGMSARSARVGDTDLHVRLLDKRADLLTYLRFADVPLRNCYRSDSTVYRNTVWDTIDVWKDPLSFCFRVERLDDSRPWGFVFGGFAAQGRAAIVLNGLYLRRRQLDQRTGVLRAIEDLIARPLGVRDIGVGNSYAGYGPLPSDYQPRSVVLTRLRALTRNGLPASYARDDISRTVNAEVTVTGLAWRKL